MRVIGFIFQRHLDTCKREPIPCTKKKCTEKPLREYFDWHLLHQCEWRMVNCEYCDGEIVACELEVGSSGNLFNDHMSTVQLRGLSLTPSI